MCSKLQVAFYFYSLWYNITRLYLFFGMANIFSNSETTASCSDLVHLLIFLLPMSNAAVSLPVSKYSFELMIMLLTVTTKLELRNIGPSCMRLTVNVISSCRLHS